MANKRRVTVSIGSVKFADIQPGEIFVRAGAAPVGDIPYMKTNVAEHNALVLSSGSLVVVPMDWEITLVNRLVIE